MPDYSFPYSTPELIQQLRLQRHPEGGYFLETDRQSQEIPSPFANEEPRSLATSIFYLLTYESRDNYFHLNKSVTYHILHHGRAEYTLIIPDTQAGRPPTIKKITMGTDVAAGEQRQLLVGTGIWKKSVIPEADIRSASTLHEQEHTGCLISEIVVPGFDWTDHTFLTKQELKDIFTHAENGEAIVEEYERFCKDKPPTHERDDLLYPPPLS